MFLFEEKELELLLERKKGFIGSKPDWQIVLSGLLFFVPFLGTEFTDVWFIPGIVFQVICILIGVAIVIFGIIKMIIEKPKFKYSNQVLFDEIKSINKHVGAFKKYSIIAIKDTFNQYPNRFLLYYDKQWECYFFPNFATLDRENEENLLQKISGTLKLKPEAVKLELKNSQIQIKFSPTRNENTSYEHRVYQATLKPFRAELKQDEFVIDNTKYKWMTIQDMRNDPVIQEKNWDVVGLVDTSRI